MSREEAGRCLSVAPIMPTTDIQRTKAHYERLGFCVTIYNEEFVMTARDDIELFLSLNPDHDPRRTASCIYVRVDDADALHRKLAATGLPKIGDPHDTDYRMREFSSIDPDGNLILFGSRLDERTAPSA